MADVKLLVTSSVLPGALGTPKNFPLALTIKQLKDKLYTVVGTAPEFQKCELRSPDGTVTALDDENATLSSYNPAAETELHVIDTDPNATIASLQDLSLVEKYKMSEDEYDKREGTYRKYKAAKEAAAAPAAEAPQEPVPAAKPGDRCEVISEDGSLNRRGTVKYVGPVDFGKGFWIGIQLDEPLGKNDGSVKGTRYFTCPDKYGCFVKPNKVTVGDFPEENLEDEL